MALLPTGWGTWTKFEPANGKPSELPHSSTLTSSVNLERTLTDLPPRRLTSLLTTVTQMVKLLADDCECVFDLLKLLCVLLPLLDADAMVEHEPPRNRAHHPQGQFMREEREGMWLGSF